MSAARAAALVGLILMSAAGCRSVTGSDTRTPSDTPESARLVTTDIARFWTAFDQMTSAFDTLPLRRDYLDVGTDGLKDFTNRRWKDARTLAGMVWPRREYYASVRANTLRVAGLESDIRRIYRSLDTLYADAVFPDVYFAIGGMATGGTTGEHGLLIGTELFSRAADSPIGSLTPWQQSVVRSIDALPVIVAHELTHYQQRYGASPETLLATSIQEGSADFVGELLSGKTINDHLRVYGDAHEAELWRSFSMAMNGSDLSLWLYNGGAASGTDGRPADLGYYVGARITAAYFDKQTNKKQALRDILTIRDFGQFLNASGYAAKFAR
jgi:hypothetical protein